MENSSTLHLERPLILSTHATEEKIVSVQEACTEDVNKAVASARKAFDEGPWRRMSAYDRGHLLFKLADLMEQHQNELAALESLDNGKPLKTLKPLK